MVEKESEVLRRRVKYLILETQEEHLGDEPVARMLSTLSDLGFQVWSPGVGTCSLVNRGL